MNARHAVLVLIQKKDNFASGSVGYSSAMTAKSQLRPYAGPLNFDEIAEGIAAAQTNAERLIADAKLLADAERFPTAAALAILAIEERGKVIILKRLAMVSQPADLKEVWRDYRNHRAKNAGWVIPLLVLEGARTLDGMSAAVDASAEHTSILDALKQVALYTDCLGDRHWSTPPEAITGDLAKSLIASAEKMWGKRPVSVRELQLWQEIVQPHYNGPGMVDAIVRCQAALNAEGLSDTRPETLAAFMRGEPVEVDPAPQ